MKENIFEQLNKGFEGTGGWYEKALAKIKDFVEELDPELDVSIKIKRVRPRGSNESYRTFALEFRHQSDPFIAWTMEIEENDDYIDNRLENIVREKYQNKKAESEGKKREGDWGWLNK